MLNTQNNAEENTNNSNSSEIIEREQIENSPFTIVGNQETGYFITMGPYRLHEPVATKEDVMNYLLRNTYNVILDMIIIVNEINKNSKKSTQEEQTVKYYKDGIEKHL